MRVDDALLVPYLWMLLSYWWTMLSSLLIWCYCSVRPTQTACGRLSQVSLEGVIFDSGFFGRCHTVGMVGRYSFSLGSEGSCSVVVGFSKRSVQVSRDMGSVGFCMKERGGALYGLKSRQFSG